MKLPPHTQTQVLLYLPQHKKVFCLYLCNHHVHWKSCKNYDASFSNGQFPLDNGHGDCINKDKTLSFVAVDTKKPASAYAEVVSFIWVYILERDLCL